LARIPPQRPLPQATAPTKPRRRHRALLAWLIAALVLVGGAGGGGAYWYFNYGPGSLVEVPPLAQLAQAEAERALTRAELGARVTLEFSDDIAAGQVISADPPSGDRVAAGLIVDLVVSRGVRMATVPKAGIISQPVTHARTALKAAGLDGQVIEDLIYHTTVDAGLVLDVRPGGGAEVAHGEPITLVVSQGPEPVDAPDLTDLALNDARSKAAEWELAVVEGTAEYSEKVAEGLIIRQSPDAGEGTHRGAEITVVVSRGMPFVEVPNVFGWNYDEASAKLSGLGLVPQRSAPLGGVFGLVQSQNPKAGESVRKGSTITLTVV
jgi:serine/threonine-protein kinase